MMAQRRGKESPHFLYLEAEKIPHCPIGVETASEVLIDTSGFPLKSKIKISKYFKPGLYILNKN